MEDKKVTIDGNTAAASVAYAFTEVAAIYPITPSSVMADQTDKFSCAGKENIFGSKVDVVEMQSEAGAAGAIHGAVSAGALATTFTSSQGLLLMIPNMYKIAGELMPNVIHVAARTVAAHALSIFGDHSDVYACRQTGYAMLSSNSPQEAAHMAAVAHLSTIKSSIPFIHFFDGFRTSHEIQKVSLPEYEDLKKMIDFDALEKFRNRALNPNSPITRGTAQNDDVYFQNREACNGYYEKVPGIVNDYMQQINEKYGTSYKPFEYYGCKNAENIIIAMGSVCETAEEVIDYLISKGEKVGLIKVRLYRPFSKSFLLSVIPKSAKVISVLDRTKEPGSAGEPLYLDVISAVKNTEFESVKVFSGRYGLSSKNTDPSHINAVFENMKSEKPKTVFTVGINDDVTNLSLNIKEKIHTAPAETYSCKFWGIGSDGTVGASKNTIKIIGDKSDLNVQGFFSYDSKKSGGLTVSHLRFGEKPIKSTYYIENADFVACHAPSYIFKYDLLKDLKPGGKFLLNCEWEESELEKILPGRIKKALFDKKIDFYILNATKISRDLGLGGRVNTALQAAFFKIVNIFAPETALEFMKEYIVKTYGKKGQKVVEINCQCADAGMMNLKKFEIPQSWGECKNEPVFGDQVFRDGKIENFVKNILDPISKTEGNNLPVSAFLPYSDGSVPLGSAAYEKRNTASFVPCWNPENCIECNLCSLVCPHAVIRPVALNESEIENAPAQMKHKKMLGVPGLEFSITVSVKDCTGCGNCAEICPGMRGKKALEMKEISSQKSAQEVFDYSQKLSAKLEVFEKFKETTIKGSQFKKPLLEFSGACAGCGETPYAKLVTQLFGDRMIVANATGCSSIWGASFPSTPYTVNEKGKGPAWQNSLFEDNAEFGYGISVAKRHKRRYLSLKIKEIQSLTKDETLKELCKNYISSFENSKENQMASEGLVSFLESAKNLDIPEDLAKKIIENKDEISKKSVWIFGGDGWAYDIGFGGLDHVLASGENVNVLVFDTEVYSNTGGQASKATPAGAVAQFAALGKSTPKKDLAAMAMSYGYVYVAKIALGANFNQAIKAIKEAESYEGPSIIIAYCPCINHGIKGGMKNSLLSAKQAVESGYWNLFDFDPRRSLSGIPALHVESKKQSLPYKDFLMTESRYSVLKNILPEKFDLLAEKSEKISLQREENLKNLAEK